MSNDDSTLNFMSSVSNLNSGMNGFVLVNFLMNFALSGSLNSLWAMINTL